MSGAEPEEQTFDNPLDEPNDGAGGASQAASFDADDIPTKAPITPSAGKNFADDDDGEGMDDGSVSPKTAARNAEIARQNAHRVQKFVNEQGTTYPRRSFPGQALAGGPDVIGVIHCACARSFWGGYT